MTRSASSDGGVDLGVSGFQLKVFVPVSGPEHLEGSRGLQAWEYRGTTAMLAKSPLLLGTEGVLR